MAPIIQRAACLTYSDDRFFGWLAQDWFSPYLALVLICYGSVPCQWEYFSTTYNWQVWVLYGTPPLMRTPVRSLTSPWNYFYLAGQPIWWFAHVCIKVLFILTLCLRTVSPPVSTVTPLLTLRPSPWWSSGWRVLYAHLVHHLSTLWVPWSVSDIWVQKKFIFVQKEHFPLTPMLIVYIWAELHFSVCMSFFS